MENLVIGDGLAKRLAQQLNLDFISIEDRVFPDGEVQPRLEKEKKANKAILIFQKKQNENINAYLIGNNMHYALFFLRPTGFYFSGRRTTFFVVHC